MLKIEAQACSRLGPSREIVFQGGLYYVQDAKLMMIRYHLCWGSFLQVKRDETHQSETWSTLLSGLPNSTSQNPESPLNIKDQQ